MQAFKAFRLSEVDKKIRSEFVDCTLDDLDPGEVVVRVAYSDVNYKDALAATGKGRILLRPACIGGIDLAGTVTESADPRFAKGDAVLATGYDIGVKHHGGYAEYARLPADWVVRVPQSLTHWEAMALGTAGFTAALGIMRMEQVGLKPGNGPVAVTGATGGVGSVAIAALARLGYHVVALTGKEQQVDWLKKLGAREVRLRKEMDMSKMKPLDKAIWAGAVDNLGGEMLAWLASTMQVGGAIASVGLAAGHTLNTTVMPFILRGVSLLGIDSVNCPMAVRQEVWRRLATDMKPMNLKTIAKTIPFAELPKAFDDFIDARVTGRTVVDLNA
jgi:putative YhdH/YhfP family quinone oxidoreductase